MAVSVEHLQRAAQWEVLGERATEPGPAVGPGGSAVSVWGPAALTQQVSDAHTCASQGLRV